MKILVVDDEEGNRALLGTLLSPYGACQYAVDGSQAVELFKAAIRDNERFDLVCLDIAMPGINGQDTLKKMRELDVKLAVPQTVIWMITSSDTGDQRVNAIYKGGCNAFISKPCTKTKIREHMRNHGFIER